MSRSDVVYGATRQSNNNTQNFKSSRELRTIRAPQWNTSAATNAILANTSGSAAIGLASDVSEARYWAQSFGLKGGGKEVRIDMSRTYAHPRAVELNAATAAVIHQVHFTVNPGTSTTTTSGNKAVSSNQNILAVVGGPRVQLYGTDSSSSFHRTLSQHTTTLKTSSISADASNIKADRQVPTGGQPAISASVRADGRLLAIGTDQGVVRIADTTSRATLCQFMAPHKLPIRAVEWFRNGQNVLSAGDDGVMRVWQLKQSSGFSSSGKNVMTECRGHGDAIRCAGLWQLSEKAAAAAAAIEEKGYPYTALAATGSYDHTIRLWNMHKIEESSTSKDDLCVSVLQHGGPVEALQWMRADPSSPTPVWLISAGGTTIKVWNPMIGKCVATVPTQHRKTITCLLAMPRIYPATTANQTTEYKMRLLTGGLDGLLRIHSFDWTTGDIRHLHGIRLNAYNDNSDPKAKSVVVGITSLAATPAADRLAIGTTTGTVLVRQKGFVETRKRTREPVAGTYAFYTRGLNAGPSADDQIAMDVMLGRNRNSNKMAKHDLALRRFRYGDALDLALETRQPASVVALLEELGKRRGLTIALSHRDEESLEPILSFLVRYIGRPPFTEVLIGIAHRVIDIYGKKHILSQSDVVDELFNKLRKQVKLECRAQRELLRLVGQIDAIMTAAEMEEQYS